jgi:outer membrane protein TolC
VRADIADDVAALSAARRELAALHEALPLLVQSEAALAQAVDRGDATRVAHEEVRAALLAAQLHVLELDEDLIEHFIALQVTVGAPVATRAGTQVKP